MTATVSAADRYTEGMTIDEYLAQMRTNRERFVENIERTRITDADRAVFGAEPVRFLVITEDWCSDSAQFVPVVARLAREVPGVELRVLRRDEHRDLAERYPRKDGYHAIPIFILFDGEMRELGSLVERPTRAAEEIAAETRKFQREHPELPGINRTLAKQPEETRAAVKAHIREWRQGQQERWTRFLLDELAAIVEAGRARRDS